jgi:KDO2-lipid IV(A) lauroyltransferase
VIRHSCFVISKWSMCFRWKPIRYRLEWLGLLLVARLIPLLPRNACRRLAQLAGWLMSSFDRHAYQVAVSNLEAAFGDQFSSSQRHQIARESFQHFARTMIDLFWSPRLTRETFARYIEWQNFEVTGPENRTQHSVIIACYHYSNFEWLSLACGFLDLKGTIISQEFKNSLLDPIFKKLREQSGHIFISRKQGLLRLYKALRRNRSTALLIDLTVPPEQGAVVIDRFGLKTSATAAHAWLQEKTGAPIIPAHCEPLPDGRYRLIFHPKIERTAGMTHQQIVQACWDSFEPYARKNPAPWLWMYKHWRYRPAKADRPYPFYANFYWRFEKMLERDSQSAQVSDCV